MSGLYWFAWAVLTIFNAALFIASWRWLGEIIRLGDEIRASDRWNS